MEGGREKRASNAAETPFSNKLIADGGGIIRDRFVILIASLGRVRKQGGGNAKTPCEANK